MSAPQGQGRKRVDVANTGASDNRFCPEGAAMSHRSKTPLRFGFAAALWLAGIASAFGQQYMPIPPGTIIGNLGGQTNAANAVDIPHLIAALSASGMPLDQMTKVGDSIYPMVPSDRVVATSAPLTASRTWTLPLAGSVTAGHPILVIDLAGGVSGPNTIVIARAGSDLINSGTTATISATFGAFYFVSDGASRWAAQSMGGVTCGTGLSGGSSGACAVALTSATNSIGADVLLNNTANYFDGPSTAQGTTGTWFATGGVSLFSGTVDAFYCKLWDGTTVIDSKASADPATALLTSISLSGIISSPAANIRISCRDLSTTAGKILFNQTGNSKDSTLTAVRIQ
jgi:hypothetical protein